VDWRRLESDRFSVYHDVRAPEMARYALTAVENAYPDLSLLLGVKLAGDASTPDPFPPEPRVSRFRRVPMILSTQVDGAAFANLTTQSIELPVFSGSGAGLYQHELVHRLMYEHFDPHVGVAGRAFSLAMVPTWWMEGLPEYLTESMGRLETAGVARTMALEDSFLSFDRMHALYKASGDVFVRGYVTAGRFFAHLVETSGRELPELMNDLSWKTLTPPFVNAERRMVDSVFQKSPTDAYAEWIGLEKERWKKALEGMPRAIPTGAKATVVSSGTPNVLAFGEGETILSQLTLKPYASAFMANRGETVRTTDDKAEQAQREVDPDAIRGNRREISLEGSGTWDVHPAELSDGGFWTVKANEFSNGTWGHEVRYVAFSGHLRDARDATLSAPVVLPLASQEDPSYVKQVFSLGDGRAFALGILRGRTTLYALNAKRKAVVPVHTWPTPHTVRLVYKARSSKDVLTENCVHVVVDADHERTSVEKICSNKSRTVVLPAEKQVVRDAMERVDGSLVMLVGWHDVLGLALLSQGVVRPLAPIPEWIEGIKPWGGCGGASGVEGCDDVGLWKFDGWDNAYHRVNPEALGAAYTKWAASLPQDSKWKRPPAYEPFVPPYARLAAQKRGRLVASRAATGAESGAVAAPESAAGASPETPPVAAPTPVPFQTLEQRNIKPEETDADYRHGHWFTYPLVVPPPLDSWSVGLVSVPFNEEMERQRVQVFGFYNFYTNRLSGSVTYLNNRVFDGLSVSAFSQERFNGYYYLYDCPTNRYDSCGFISTREPGSKRFRLVSYLREEGGEIATLHRFQPSSIWLGTRLRGYRLRPLYERDSPFYADDSPALGVQRTVVAQGGADLGFTLFEAAFYDRGARTGGSWLDWKTSLVLSADKFKSVSDARKGDDTPSTGLDYQSYVAAGTSMLGYKNHALTLRGRLASTRGGHTLNLRETFQPYTTYLLGSGSGLNQLNYPLAGDAALFTRRAGTTSYRTTLDYNFPIVEELDSNFAIFYFETLRGEMAVGRGGVTDELNLTGFKNVDSASVATRLTIDVKGVQVFPSLAYGKILGGDGWALFTELAFSQFF
jgi:hypothetical protein